MAYWVINTLDKYERKLLLMKVIKAVTIAGVKIHGYSSNISMCELLGANLNAILQTFNRFSLTQLTMKKYFSRSMSHDQIGSEHVGQ